MQESLVVGRVKNTPFQTWNSSTSFWMMLKPPYYYQKPIGPRKNGGWQTNLKTTRGFEGLPGIFRIFRRRCFFSAQSPCPADFFWGRRGRGTNLPSKKRSGWKGRWKETGFKLPSFPVGKNSAKNGKLWEIWGLDFC